MSQDTPSSYLCDECTKGYGAYAKPTFSNVYDHPTRLIMELVKEFFDDKEVEEYIRRVREQHAQP